MFSLSDLCLLFLFQSFNFNTVNKWNPTSRITVLSCFFYTISMTENYILCISNFPFEWITTSGTDFSNYLLN